MKKSMLILFALVVSVTSLPVWSAEEADGDSKSMQIEKIIEACENQFKEEDITDPEERNRLIDQCIDEQTASSEQGGS